MIFYEIIDYAKQVEILFHCLCLFTLCFDLACNLPYIKYTV